MGRAAATGASVLRHALGRRAQRSGAAAAPPRAATPAEVVALWAPAAAAPELADYAELCA